MAWSRKASIEPIKGCYHKMVWTNTQCWCKTCGQTWGWTPKHLDDAGKTQGGGWFVQAIHQVKFGKYAAGDEF